MEATHQYRGRLAERSPDILCRWNETVDAVKPATYHSSSL